MSNVNQLLAKALSTTSEEEAISCLRMARKRGGRLEETSSGTYNGQTAKYWYDKASTWYNKAKSIQSETGGLSRTQQHHLFSMYQQAQEDVLELRSRNSKLQDQIYKAKAIATSSGKWKVRVILLQAAIIGLLIVNATK